MTRTRWIAGCMTGTSLDGLDVALAEIEGTGLDMKASFRGMVSRPLGDLANQLRHFAEGKAAPPIDYLRAARELGELHADAVEELCKKYLQRPPTPVGGFQPAPKLDFIVAHGQTIWHAPAEHLSWQLFDPWPLARRLQVPVCYDLRQADLIAGGQGAPITPMADWMMYRQSTPRFVVNLGGIANVTWIGGGISDTGGRDLIPCNLLLDSAVQRLYPSVRFDEDGRIAMSGEVVEAYRRAMVFELMEVASQSRSLGREQILGSLMDEWIKDAVSKHPPANILATYVAAVADLIWAGFARRLVPQSDVVLAGGGARNEALVAAIKRYRRGDATVNLSDDLGIPCEAREALAFAILGALSQDGVAITLPQVTGSKHPGKAGAWVYP